MATKTNYRKFRSLFLQKKAFTTRIGDEVLRAAIAMAIYSGKFVTFLVEISGT